jgi:arabinose-5-phosphate isomerase
MREEPFVKPDTEEILASGRRVLKTEANALGTIADSLGEGFTQAVETILGSTGRVIVSGIGKSGHVARKIAATFASTGTPAQFVHPAEASHGDLGMVVPGDVALILSNSGETAELADIIAHTRRFGIKLIGVASRAASTLLTQADVPVLLPPMQEACRNGLAPTTSTTAMMALGDAIAVALMEHRHFTPDDFRSFHPGGSLGARLMPVSGLMHKGDDVPIVSGDTAMQDVLLTMTRKGFGVAGVADPQGALIGIISDGDLRRNMDGLMDKQASAVMTKDPKTIGADTILAEAIGVMNSFKITSLFVVRDNQAIGILHMHDCLRAGVR